MSDSSSGRGDAYEAALSRFAQHREAWKRNSALRTLYADWWQRIREELPPAGFGPRVEIGSGPGLGKTFIPDLVLTDLVRAPWHDHEVDAEKLPFSDATIGAVVLFDVLHHIPDVSQFFDEAGRVLVKGGRIVMCEPYLSPASYCVYRFFHEEDCDTSVDPFVPGATNGDPFAGNQAIPTLLFWRRAHEFAKRLPGLRIVKKERLAGLAYPASGGFGRSPLLPTPLVLWLARIERIVPAPMFRAIGFRTLVVLERV